MPTRHLFALLAAILSAFVLSGCCCIPSESEEMAWTVLAHRDPNRNSYHPDMNFVIVNEEGETFEHWHGLKGESLEWGTEYKLRIKRNVYEGYIDSDKIEYKIDKVLGRTERYGESFRMHQVMYMHLSGDTGRFIDGTPYTCPDPVVCETLLERLGPHDSVDLVMKHGEKAGDPLVLLSVEDPTCTEVFGCYDQSMDCVDGICQKPEWLRKRDALRREKRQREADKRDAGRSDADQRHAP